MGPKLQGPRKIDGDGPIAPSDDVTSHDTHAELSPIYAI